MAIKPQTKSEIKWMVINGKKHGFFMYAYDGGFLIAHTTMHLCKQWKQLMDKDGYMVDFRYVESEKPEGNVCGNCARIFKSLKHA